MTERRETAAMLFYDERGVLLQLRDFGKDIINPGMLAIFGGHLEQGETPLSCLRREVEEELGITVENPPLFRPFHSIIAGIPYIEHIFYAPLPVPLSELRLAEGCGFAMVPPSAFDAFPMGENTRKVLAAFASEHGDLLKPKA